MQWFILKMILAKPFFGQLVIQIEIEKINSLYLDDCVYFVNSVLLWIVYNNLSLYLVGFFSLVYWPIMRQL